MQRCGEIGLLKLIMAGALGSMLGTLVLESLRGKKPIHGWLLLVGLVFAFSRLGKHPLIMKKIEAEVLDVGQDLNLSRWYN